MVGFGEFVKGFFDLGGRGVMWDGEGFVVVWDFSLAETRAAVEGVSCEGTSLAF
jgi:hypothetical protein